MEKEALANTRLWIENREGQMQKPSGPPSYNLKSYKLKPSTVKLLQKSSKETRLSTEAYLKTAWGLLLCHYSGTTSFYFLTGNTQQAKQGAKKVSAPSLHEGQYSHASTLKQLKAANKKRKISAKKASELQYDRYILGFSPAGKATSNDLILDAQQNILLCVIPKKLTDNITLQYNQTILSADAVKQLFTHFERLLEAICTNPNTQQTNIPILLPREEKKVLQEWRGRKTKGSTIGTTLTHKLLAKHALKAPSQLAVCHNKSKLTYLELDTKSSRLANGLIKNGINVGDNVAVLLRRNTDLIIAIMAIFKCGGVYTPINAKYPDERVDYVLHDSKPKIIITDNINRIPDQYREISNTVATLSTHEDASSPKVEYSDQEIAYTLYTSGTTGKPKGVRIRHNSLTNLSAWYKECFKLSTKDQVSQFASQGFDTHICEIIPTIAIGGTIHIVDDSIKLSPRDFFSWLVSRKITICDLPTAYAQVLLKQDWPKDIALKLLKIGGESLTNYPDQKFSFDLWNTYGPTEATIETTFEKIYSANDAPNKSTNAPTIGTPLFNSEVVIVDDYFKPVPVGVAGEILIGGVNVAKGYLNREDLNNKAFVELSFQSKEPSKKYYRTGDLARWLPNGHIDFIGRVDHQVKIRGYRIELGDIENALSQYPDVNEAVVVVKENIKGEKMIVSYVATNLEKERYLYQERCLISLDNHRFHEAISDDISKTGIALSSIPENIKAGDKVYLHIKLPGMNDAKTLNGIVVWRNNDRCGLSFSENANSVDVLSKSVEYYLSKHNVSELVLSSSAKRNLKKALARKLPEYMVPNSVVKLLNFPLTLSGKVDVKSLPPPEEYSRLAAKEYIPAKSKTEKKLATIWCEILKVDSVSMSDNFFDIGGNSLLAAELSIKIVSRFNITIPVRLLFDLAYIPILAQYIDSDGESYANQSLTHEEIARDVILQESYQPPDSEDDETNKPIEHILLTGAGGFLGIHLLRTLLKKTNATIYCLIRKGNFESAAMRLMSTVERFRLHDDVSLKEKRIVVISSDISHAQFGMPTDLYNSLANKVDLIYHCGAQVNIMASYNLLRSSNVEGTLEIIKFAIKNKAKPIHYISTLSSAYMKDESGHLAEVFPDNNHQELFGGYAISKWVSERLLTQIKTRGLPVTLYRSGYIFGQADTGVTSLNDALLMLIKGSIQMGFAPKLDEKIALLPVDFVSEAVAAISLEKTRDSGVYHVDHPVGIMWVDLVQWMNSYGFNVKLIPIVEWKEKLKSITKDNALYPFLPYYLSLDEKYLSPEVNVEKAKSFLTQSGLEYPKIDENLLTIYFDYLCHVGFLPTETLIEEHAMLLEPSKENE